MALRNVTGMITGGSGGGNVFTQDSDPELVRDALPFALKTYESLLAADPTNRDMALATSSAFVQYAIGFLAAEADVLEDVDYVAARKLRERAVNLSLRGRDYALAALENSYPGFRAELEKTPEAARLRLKKTDVPLVYWAAAGWGAAIAAAPGNMALVAELPVVEVLMRRALELDESWDYGAIHDFFVRYDGGRSEMMGGSVVRAREHFERVVELCSGQKASPYVGLASTVAVGQQDYASFRELLEQALAIDLNARPEWRLGNTLSQREAQRLLDRSADLFVDYEESDE